MQWATALATPNIFMRLWTLHPRYLDAKGLVAAWREALLAQKVLSGGTRGYRNHPQLLRFKSAPDPSLAIAAFLSGLAAEARARGYNFDTDKIVSKGAALKIRETHGQLHFEWKHLKKKLKERSPLMRQKLRGIAEPESHPLFRIVAGDVRAWEIRPQKTSNPRVRRVVTRVVARSASAKVVARR